MPLAQSDTHSSTLRIRIRKPSEHGLGHLLNPDDPNEHEHNWIEHQWEQIVRGTTESLSWHHRPAVSRSTVSSPRLVRAFTTFNHGKAYADQIKPFAFHLTAHPAPFERSATNRLHLIAPYSTDPAQWSKQRWINVHGGRLHPISTRLHGPSAIRVRTYQEVLAEYATHPEHKSTLLGSTPRLATGLLDRRTLRAAAIVYIGKESNMIEEVELGLADEIDEPITEYQRSMRDLWEREVRPWLLKQARKTIASALGVNEKQVQRWRTGAATPRPSHVGQLRTMMVKSRRSE